MTTDTRQQFDPARWRAEAIAAHEEWKQDQEREIARVLAEQRARERTTLIDCIINRLGLDVTEFETWAWDGEHPRVLVDRVWLSVPRHHSARLWGWIPCPAEQPTDADEDTVHSSLAAGAVTNITDIGALYALAEQHDRCLNCRNRQS